MLVFNDIRITEEDSLHIDCQINSENDNTGEYIYEVYLEYYKNRPIGGVNDDMDPSDYARLLYHEDTPLNPKYVAGGTAFDITYTLDDLNNAVGQQDENDEDKWPETFDKGLFYVIVVCKKGSSETSYMAIALDWKYLYTKGFAQIGTVLGNCGNSCTPPKAFEQFTLLWFALRMALDIPDYEKIEQIWEKILYLTLADGNYTSGSGCSC